tara:strand:+ start:2165 stop:2602 length:438 start_codon:yes stop_codon:yes gene_type:complete
VENKIHYRIDNSKSYDHVQGVIPITTKTFCSYKNTIEDSINSFNKNVEWDGMWDLSEAEERLKIGDVLWIGVDKEGPLAHVWFKDNYLYNMYVDPRRPDNYAVRFVQFCIQFIDSKEIILYCDEWNIAAQKMFEKVGFEKYTPNK